MNARGKNKGNKKSGKKRDDKSIWALIDGASTRTVTGRPGKETEETEENRYYAEVPPFNSSRQVQELISDHQHHVTQRRRAELKEDGKLKGWRKQEGLGSIAQFQVLLEMESDMKRRLKILYDAQDNGRICYWYSLFGSVSGVETSLTWVQNMLEEFRYQRDNPRLARETIGNPKSRKKGRRKRK